MSTLFIGGVLAVRALEQKPSLGGLTGRQLHAAERTETRLFKNVF